MDRLKNISTFNLQMTESNVIGRGEVPKPSEYNMNLLVNRINTLTEIVNILATRQGLIEPETENNSWG